MKSVLALILAFFMILVLGGTALAATVATANLITDGGDNPTDVGDLVVDYDSVSGNITVNFTSIDSPWEIYETHVYISSVEPPQKHTPGKFPYVDGQSVNVPDLEAGDLVYIAAHAEIRQWIPPEGEIPGYWYYETVWAQTGSDELIRNAAQGRKGNAWATFFAVEPIPD